MGNLRDCDVLGLSSGQVRTSKPPEPGRLIRTVKFVPTAGGHAMRRLSCCGHSFAVDRRAACRSAVSANREIGLVGGPAAGLGLACKVVGLPPFRSARIAALDA